MVFNVDKLKGKIKENRYSRVGFAKTLGMCDTTLGRKMEDAKYDFTISESLEVKEKLNLTTTEYLEIFFGNKLESKSR